MNLPRVLILIFLSHMVITPCARGQIVWNVEYPPGPATRIHQYTALSCYGNNCTVADNYLDIQKKAFGYEFVESTDAGLTWASYVLTWPGDTLQYNITKVQQIDSLHTVAIGSLKNNSSGGQGLFVSSSDAGATWRIITPPPSNGIIGDVDFSDSVNGIIVVGGANPIYTTSDGGAHWNAALIKLPLQSVHSYGGGKFRGFAYGHGPIYTTYDNWATCDSTQLIFDSTTDPNYQMLLGNCAFSGDTLIASGAHRGDRALLIRSTDGGISWDKPWTFDTGTNMMNPVNCISPIDRDTIFAGCPYSYSRLLISTDKGASWNVVSTSFADTNYEGDCRNGISLLSGGSIVGVFGLSPSVLARSSFALEQVELSWFKDTNIQVYPNPASQSITVSSLTGPVSILDPLGRSYEVARNGNTLDISSLPSGVYFVSDGHTRAKFVKK